jgi:Kef-type K+ transport system membrane component KefB
MTLQADPVATLVGGLAVLLLAAKLGGELAIRVKQPAVLGELIAGIILGNVWFGPSPFRALAEHDTIQVIAGIGALILLFEVGIESTVGQMLKVGLTSLLVAVLGVVVPFALGWGVSAWLLPGASPYVHAFIGATLCATSVGITARVFQDLGASRTQEARIILGAAVIDDVLGLVILGAVSGAIGAAAQGRAILRAVGGANLRRGDDLPGGRPRHWHVCRAACVCCRVAPPGAGCARHGEPEPVLRVGLGFESHRPGADRRRVRGWPRARRRDFKDFVRRGERSLEELIRPIADLLVPIFFVLMGLRTDLRAFAFGGSLELAAALIVVAIIGKQACALGVTMPGVNRLAVGTALKWSLERANISPRSRVES